MKSLNTFDNYKNYKTERKNDNASPSLEALEKLY